MKLYDKNGINILLQKTASTPRFSIQFFFNTVKKEKYFGLNSLLARLLLQGTKNYSAEELASKLENECIDVSVKSKQDFIKITADFLNQDFNLAMEIIQDIILNSTCDNLEKEIYKMKGEIISDLDNPKLKLTDCFVKTIFKDHPYSSTHTKILDDIDKITKEDILNAYKNMFDGLKSIVITGDYDNEDKIIGYFENNFSFMQSTGAKDEIEDIFINDIKKDEIVFIEKEDASQAQILQGWLVDSFKSEYSAKYALLNNILGSSGLSSRLFVNLRDKKGLAYNVRSQYETLLHSAMFHMYIGCDTKNILKSLDGFREELKKIANVPPDERELTGAKENISGRLKYFTQNNSQISAVYGYNFMMGLGLNYNEKFLKDIFQTDAQSVSNMAKKLLSMPKLTVIVAPKEYKI